MIEESSRAFLPHIVLQALTKTNGSDQKQHSGKQIPGTRQKVCSMRNGSGRGGKKRGARSVGSEGHNQQRRSRFLAGLPSRRHIALHSNGGEQKDSEQRAAYHPTHWDAGECQGTRCEPI